MAKRTFIGFVFAALFLMISATAMAYSIRDDATGGDCTQIGVWDAGTKTCTLTRDIYEGISIDSDGITLDGNGQTIHGNNAGIGVSLSGREDVLIKNLNVKQFPYGIYLYYSNNNRLLNNTIAHNYWSYGIMLYGSSNNIVSHNVASSTYFGGGILLVFSTDNVLSFNNTSNTFYGYGLRITGSGNLISDNIASKNGTGIYINGSGNILNGNTLAWNTVSGMTLTLSGNKIFNNNFIANSKQTWIYGDGYNNTFTVEASVGGNYWSDYDAPEEGCNDLNNDGFCDSPYYFTVGVDYLPWTTQDGWVTPKRLIENVVAEIGTSLSSGVITNEGIATSLISTLENALVVLDQGNIQAAENMLQAFINKVEAQSGKQITGETATALIEAAKQIINKMQ